jgi:hypothetical protein
MAKRTKPVTHKPVRKAARKNQQAAALPATDTTHETPEAAASTKSAPEIAGISAADTAEIPAIEAEDAAQTTKPDDTDNVSNDEADTDEQPDIAEPSDREYISASEASDASEPTGSVSNSIAHDAAGSRTAARGRRRRAGLLLAILLIGILGALVWRIHMRADPNAENTKLIAEVAQRAVLPTGEKPTVTTIVDKDKVNQSFLQNAHNGDKVLLYFQAGKAVVYRPSTRQIVNIGPLTQPPAQVFLRDGTGKGIPSSFRDKLSQPAGFTVVSQDTSAKATYTRTLVVDIAGNRPDIAARVATLTGGHVGPLPAGESRPDADILVISGSDAK